MQQQGVHILCNITTEHRSHMPLAVTRYLFTITEHFPAVQTKQNHVLAKARHPYPVAPYVPERQVISFYIKKQVLSNYTNKYSKFFFLKYW